MMNLFRRATICCAAALLALPACQEPRPEGWTPVLEQTSTAFLRQETQGALDRVREARAKLGSEPEEAGEALQAADRHLEQLLLYYLPLLEARERAYNAYRHYLLRETSMTLQELEEIGKILLAVSEKSGGHLLRELEPALEEIETAKVELDVDSERTEEVLVSLARRLNFLLLKGKLVLDD